MSTAETHQGPNYLSSSQEMLLSQMIRSAKRQMLTVRKNHFDRLQRPWQESVRLSEAAQMWDLSYALMEVFNVSTR